METVFTFTHTLQGRDVDLYNRWRLESLFNHMQMAGLEHAEALGCGYEAMLQRDVAWVLGRVRLEAQYWPGEQETVRIQTWPGPTAHTLFPRYFAIETDAGRPVARVQTVWAALDLSTRQMRGADCLPCPLPVGEKPEPMPALHRLVPETEETLIRDPVYNDFDRNGHVNNARYPAWFADGVPLDYQRDHILTGFQLAYSREIRVGSPLALTYGRRGDGFSCRGGWEDNCYFQAQGLYSPCPESRRQA